MIVCMQLRRRIGYLAWALLAVLLALIAAWGLVNAIMNSGSTENRAPAGRIVLAAITLAVALVAASAVLGRLRGTDGRIGLVAGLALTGATIVLLFLLALGELASGPL
jgi:hypothetical protein